MSINDQSRARKTYSFYRSQPVSFTPIVVTLGSGLRVQHVNGMISITTQSAGAKAGGGGQFDLTSSHFNVSSGSINS